MNLREARNLLNLQTDHTEQDIMNNFSKLMKLYHPDKSKDQLTAGVAQQLREARELLMQNFGRDETTWAAELQRSKLNPLIPPKKGFLLIQETAVQNGEVVKEKKSAYIDGEPVSPREVLSSIDRRWPQLR